MKKKIWRQEIGRCFFIAFVILGSDSLLFATNSNEKFIRFSQLVIVFSTVILVCLFFLKRKRVSKTSLYLYLTIVSVVLSIIVNGMSGGALLKISLLLFGYITMRLISYGDFVGYYTKIMKFLAIVSIIGVMFGGIIIELNILPIISNNNNLTFSSAFFTNIPTWGVIRHRNFGPFWEPGVYQAYLFIALYFSLFVIKEKKKYTILLFIIAIITTFSTTGYLCMLLLLIAYLLKNNDLFISKNKALIVLVFFSLIIFLVVEQEASDILFGKILEGSANESFGSRFESIWTNLKIFINNPIFGVGPDNVLAHFNSVVLSHGDANLIVNTNTIFSHFSSFGIVLGVYYLSLLYKFATNNNIPRLSAVLILLALTIILSSEYFMYSLLFNTLFFYGTVSQNTNTY